MLGAHGGPGDRRRVRGGRSTTAPDPDDGISDHYLVVAGHGLGAEVTTRPGDSGALVLEAASRRVVGLVRAGEPDGAADCIATPVATVLARLRVSFL